MARNSSANLLQRFGRFFMLKNQCASKGMNINVIIGDRVKKTSLLFYYSHDCKFMVRF